MNKNFLSLKTLPAYWMWKPSLYNNKELELSFLSVKKFAPWVTEYYVLSTINPEIDGLTWVPIEPVEGGTDKHLFHTINNNLDKLPDYWLYMNDDFYFIDHMNIDEFYLPYAYGINVRERGSMGRGNGFAKCLWDTMEYVREKYDCYVNFCSHCPFIMDKSVFISRINDWHMIERVQFETWLFAETNVEWRPAGSVRSMWIHTPPNKECIYNSINNSGYKLLAHDDYALEHGNTYLLDFLEEIVE